MVFNAIILSLCVYVCACVCSFACNSRMDMTIQIISVAPGCSRDGFKFRKLQEGLLFLHFESSNRLSASSIAVLMYAALGNIFVGL